jgi:hypothetical protein
MVQWALEVHVASWEREATKVKKVIKEKKVRKVRKDYVGNVVIGVRRVHVDTLVDLVILANLADLDIGERWDRGVQEDHRVYQDVWVHQDSEDQKEKRATEASMESLASHVVAMNVLAVDQDHEDHVVPRALLEDRATIRRK